MQMIIFFFFSSRRRHTRSLRDWSSDVCSSDLGNTALNKLTNSSVRTGLLPAFATFEAKGKEAGMNLGIHFGFAPQINNGAVHDNFGNGTQAGAQIDMRQVYLTVGGAWGEIVAGRERGLVSRQNIF